MISDNDIVIHTVAVGDPTAFGEKKLDEAALCDLSNIAGRAYFHASYRKTLEEIYYAILTPSLPRKSVIRKILKHPGFWDDKPRPKAKPPPGAELEYIIEDAIPSPDDMVVASIYPAETYIDSIARRAFDNYQEYLDRYGEERTITEMDFPRVSAARLLPPAIRTRVSRHVAA